MNTAETLEPPPSVGAIVAKLMKDEPTLSYEAAHTRAHAIYAERATAFKARAIAVLRRTGALAALAVAPSPVSAADQQVMLREERDRIMRESPTTDLATACILASARVERRLSKKIKNAANKIAKKMVKGQKTNGKAKLGTPPVVPRPDASGTSSIAPAMAPPQVQAGARLTAARLSTLAGAAPAHERFVPAGAGAIDVALMGGPGRLPMRPVASTDDEIGRRARKYQAKDPTLTWEQAIVLAHDKALAKREKRARDAEFGAASDARLRAAGIEVPR